MKTTIPFSFHNILCTIFAHITIDYLLLHFDSKSLYHSLDGEKSSACEDGVDIGVNAKDDDDGNGEGKINTGE